MSSSPVSDPDPPGLLSDSSQDVINQWFTHYSFSFSNPEDIAVRLTQIKKRHKRRRPNQILPGNCDRLLGILREISLFPNHRHRRDAANIIDQVNARMRRGTVERLIPEPMGFPSTGNPGDGHSPAAHDILAVLTGNLPPDRPPGEPIPDVSARRIYPTIAGAAPASPPDNQVLVDAGFRWIPDDEDFMIAMENLRSMRADDPGLHAPLLVDNPREIVMEFSENIPLITAPLPQVDPALQTATRTPLTIYDTRAWSQGARGAINEDHYIYHLIDLCRTKLLHPSVAAKYAIVNRAHPSRYRTGSTDNIADEPPASTNEVEGVMRWVLHGFPVIEILSNGFTQGGREDIEDTYGFVDRGTRHSHKLCLNALFFNTIEQAYREREDYDAIVFLLFVTVAHEFGHYLNTCWHIGGDHRAYFGTPRGLRYLVQSDPTDDPEHPDFDPAFLVCGEIGEVMEWLIFGFTTVMPRRPGVTDWVGRSLSILGWGSRPPNTLRIDNLVGRRLMQTRPHLRLPAHELRVFTENLREEYEGINLSDLGYSDEEGADGVGPSEPRTSPPSPAASAGSPGREESEGMDLADLGDGYKEVTVGSGPPEPRTSSPAAEPSAVSPRREESVGRDIADLGDGYEEVTIGAGARQRPVHEPGTFSPESEVPAENPREEEKLGETGPWDPGDGNGEGTALGEAPDVDAERSGVSIPNTARGKAFRHSLIFLEGEIERARARRRARGRPNRAISCRPGELDGLGSGPNFGLHNNINWSTDETPPRPSSFLSFLTNFDHRTIMVCFRLWHRENISRIRVRIFFDRYSNHNCSRAILSVYDGSLNQSGNARLGNSKNPDYRNDFNRPACVDVLCRVPGTSPLGLEFSCCSATNPKMGPVMNHTEKPGQMACAKPSFAVSSRPPISLG
ncbi:hypothetical protein HOY82DRAFT_625816 [Tuber indicum]|nr:hypothetical protein HOY82DRAFT_625816 [Tuber indicum]